MVAQLIALQIKLSLRSFRGNLGKIIGLAVVGIYATGAIALLWLGAAVVRSESPDIIGVVTTLVMSLVSVMWICLLLMLGSADPLAAGKFALLPVSAKQLRPGLAAAEFFSLGGVITTAIAVGFLISWSLRPVNLLIAVLAAALGQFMAILVIRTVNAAMAGVFSSRRFRDLSGLVLGVLIMAAVLWLQLTLNTQSQVVFEIGAPALTQAARVVSWTPFGWAWALPWDFMTHAWVPFGLRLAGCLTVLAVFWRLWGRFFDRALVSPIASGGPTGHVKGMSFFDRLMPPTAAGAIGARTLRYWLRDPRRQLQGFAMLLLPVLFLVLSTTWGLPKVALVLIPSVALSITALTLTSSELSYDGAALHVEVLAGTTGRDDRWGRVLALGVLIGSVSVIMTIAATVYTGSYASIGLALCTALGVLAIAMGVGSIAGAIWTYPVPPPEESMSSRGNLSSAVGALLAMLVQFCIASPVVLLAYYGLSNSLLAWVSVPVSLIVGALTLWLGVVLGGKYLDARWPETLANITYSKR